MVSYRETDFRIRAGDYRLLYMFGDREGWVCVLTVDERDDVYEKVELIDTVAPSFDFSQLPSDATGLAPQEAIVGYSPALPVPGKPIENELESPIDRALLVLAPPNHDSRPVIGFHEPRWNLGRNLHMNDQIELGA